MSKAEPHKTRFAEFLPDESWSTNRLKTELFELAKEIGVINSEFSRENFSQRFFYFFIERSNEEKSRKFGEDQFGEPYKNSMLRAFYFIFKLVQHNRQTGEFLLDSDIINQIYKLAASNALPDDRVGYRNSVSAGFSCNDTSRKFMTQLAKDDYHITLQSIGLRVGRCYIPEVEEDDCSGKAFLLRYCMDHLTPEQIFQVVNQLVLEYHINLRILAKMQLSPEIESLVKSQNIGNFIGEMALFHPYEDGNGRTFCFALLNYLLISQRLAPAMVFNPWHLPYNTSEERLEIILEGQLAHRYFFLEGNELQEENRLVILSPRLVNILLFRHSGHMPLIAAMRDIYNFDLQLKLLPFRADINEEGKQVLEERSKQSLKAAVEFIDKLNPAAIGEFFPLPILKKQLVENAVLNAIRPIVYRLESREQQQWKRDLLKERFKIDMDEFDNNPQYHAEILQQFDHKRFHDLRSCYLEPILLDHGKSLFEYVCDKGLQRQIIEEKLCNKGYDELVKYELLYFFVLPYVYCEIENLRREMAYLGLEWNDADQFDINLEALQIVSFPEEEESFEALARVIKEFDLQVSQSDGNKFSDELLLVKTVLDFKERCKAEYLGERKGLPAASPQLALENEHTQIRLSAGRGL